MRRRYRRQARKGYAITQRTPFLESIEDFFGCRVILRLEGDRWLCKSREQGSSELLWSFDIGGEEEEEGGSENMKPARVARSVDGERHCECNVLGNGGKD